MKILSYTTEKGETHTVDEVFINGGVEAFRRQLREEHGCDIYFTIQELPFEGVDFLGTVADHYGVTTAEITGKSRTLKIVEARHIFFKVQRHFSKISTSKIGAMANRNHSTVVQGIQAINDRIDTDRFLRERYEALHEKIVQMLN